MKKTRALSNAEWENPTAKLACFIACYTGISTTTLEEKKQMNIKETTQKLAEKRNLKIKDIVKIPEFQKLLVMEESVVENFHDLQKISVRHFHIANNRKHTLAVASSLLCAKFLRKS